MAWLTNWNYRKAITVSNSGSTLTDYQVLTTIDTLTLINAGKMRSDCGDIRFTDTDGSTLINYWIESGQNTVSTKIWAKIPSVPTSKTIYLYYGNPSTTSVSNGTNTFVFFDDFLGSSLSASWTSSGSVSVSGGIVSLGTANTVIYTGLNYTGDLVLRSREKRYQPSTSDGNHETQSSFQDSTIQNAWDSSNNVVGYSYDASGQGFRLSSRKAGNSYWGGNNYLFDSGANWHISEITWSSNLDKWTWDSIIVGFTSDTTKIPIIALRVSFGTYTHLQEIDWVCVRKYASAEPTTTLESEETPANITATSMTITLSENPCRVGICTVTVNVTWTNNGGTSGDFIPNITIDGTPYSSPYSLQSLGAGLPVTKTFTISGLAVGTRNICPYPN